MRFALRAAGTLLLVGALGCGGDGVCVQICGRIRNQLIVDFGVPPNEINCSDSKWQKADTCEKCMQLLENDYGVARSPSPECLGNDGGQ